MKTVEQKKGILYVIECKREEQDTYFNKKRYLKYKKKNIIDKFKYEKLMNRMKEDWVMCDALSNAESYGEIKAQFIENKALYPGKEFRIVRAVCTYSEYGMSICDMDYDRLEVIPTYHLLERPKFFEWLQSRFC